MKYADKDIVQIEITQITSNMINTRVAKSADKSIDYLTYLTEL